MRRTKAEAEQTRRAILSAALRTFHRLGISSTTMERVAEEAGVTRGAIYWHFQDKQALLRAIRDEVALPLVDRADITLLHDRDADPLDRVERFILDLVTEIDRDPRTRLVYSLMSFKCEYVGPLEAELGEYVRKIEHARQGLLEVYQQARTQKKLRAGVTPRMAALETIVFVAGLVRLCLLEDHGLAVRKDIRALVAAHVASRRPA